MNSINVTGKHPLYDFYSVLIDDKKRLDINMKTGKLFKHVTCQLTGIFHTVEIKKSKHKAAIIQAVTQYRKGVTL